MEKVFRNLIEFQTAAGYTLPDGPPAISTLADMQLGMRLVKGEYKELKAAIEAGDLAEIADGCADLIYTTTWLAVRCGIDLPAIWDVVQTANMAKHGPGSWKDEWNKVRKPPGWQHPDIAGILAQQKPLAEIYGDTGIDSGDKS